MSILVETMFTSLQEVFKLSDDQLIFFVVDFESHLTEYLKKTLHPEYKAL